jgi:ParB-like chromosome segregation protein Spo0J
MDDLLTEDEFLRVSGLSVKALRKWEKARYVKPANPSGEAKRYTRRDAEIAKSMMRCLGRCANLREAYEMALQGMSSKKRRSSEADSGQLQTIDPKKIKMHPRFKGLMDIDEDLAESLTADMAVGGYYASIPIVLGEWPGLKGRVLIDGHTRVRAADKGGVQKVPYVIEKFDNEDGALQYIANVQTKRRPTDDWVLYQLISELDSLMDRGGDRRSEQAKSKSSQEPTETMYATSAERTAALVGCKPSMVKRARRIRKDATPEILDDLKNRKKTISQAEKEIAKMSKGNKKTEAESPIKENQEAKVRLTDENLVALKELGGNLHSLVNRAVEEFISRFKEKERTEEPE